MNQDDIFDSLVQNAFDFLERGIADFGSSPKYSVIHFCAAVEMLIKARLMKEHWSLIISKPDQANLTKFMAGNFESVNLQDARNRLSSIAQEEIPSEAFNSFRALANHRNKMIHFFHADIEGDEKAKATIVAEHCCSWFHLHRLLNRWEIYFKDYQSDIARADRAMKAHRKYLSAKFHALKSELSDHRKAGVKPITCSACGFKSAISEPVDEKIASVWCKVCDHVETQVKIACPHCKETIVIANEGYAICAHCGGEVNPEDILELLVDHAAAHMAIKDGDDSWEPANCASCGGYHSVIKRDEKYFCTNCFDISDGIEFCGWCNEPNTGDMEDSYAIGCSHCDGKVGWEKDD